MSSVIAIIEARMTSSRLPGKVLMPAGGKPLLQILIERLSRADSLDGIVVATTINDDDEPIAALCERMGVGCFRGSEDNVLERVCGAATKFNADVIVEITGDCPLVDPWQVDQAVKVFSDGYPDTLYVSNGFPAGNSPMGMSVQVFKTRELLDVLDTDPDELEREHVSCRFYSEEGADRYRPRHISYAPPMNRPDIWVTLDYVEDYELIKALYEDVSIGNANFGIREVIEWVDLHPDQHNRSRKKRGL